MTKTMKIVLISCVVLCVAATIGAYLRHSFETYYVVSFDTQGGSAVESGKVKSGSTIMIKSTPTKEGYTFEGWYQDGKMCTVVTVYSDMTFVAKWSKISDSEEETPEEYTVTFESNGGTSVATQRVTAGSIATIPNMPTKSGAKFVGWYIIESSPEGERYYEIFNFNTPVTADVTVYATWIITPEVLSREISPGYFNIYSYSNGEDLMNSICDTEIYEVKNGKYIKVGSIGNGMGPCLKIEPGETRTFVARTILYNKGEYSEYSKPITITIP